MSTFASVHGKRLLLAFAFGACVDSRTDTRTEAPPPAPPAPVQVTATPPPPATPDVVRAKEDAQKQAEEPKAARDAAAVRRTSPAPMPAPTGAMGLTVIGDLAAASPTSPELRATGSGRGGGGAALGAFFSMGYGSASAGIGGGSVAGIGKVAVGVRANTPAPAPDYEGTERYSNAGVNPFTAAAEDRLSTFSIDVDTGSYTLARRKIHDGSLPSEDGVRVEEFLNYFRYPYAPPASGPLAVHLDAAPSPYAPDRTLLRVGVQGRTIPLSERKPAHLTFLVDVSGSMQSADKLPLAQKALRILVDNLRDGDTVGLVTYAGGVREVLKPTGLEKKAEIHQAIDSLAAGGSTSMSGGIELAYTQASKMLGGGRNVRVVILSDGDANVGATSHDAILKLVAGKVKEGITCSVVGFGVGNYRDDLMEGFADKGNGNYAYVDSALQARRVFQEQLGGTLEVIAKDVKLQVEFDPAQVKRYRLVGYENRRIADRDFRNDKVDAGEIGSGHTVTALYELELLPGAGRGLATVRIRAKQPAGETADEQAFEFPASALSTRFEDAPRDLRFATAVMGAAEILRGSAYAKGWSLADTRRIAEGAIDGSPAALVAERREFVELLRTASKLTEGVAVR